MSKRENNARLQELFNKNIPIYSYSRLSSYSDNCKYNYYLAYISKQRSADNIYSGIGSVTHDSIENVYHKQETLEEAKEKFHQAIKELEKNGIKFPDNPPTTKTNYITNMDHFYDNYTVMDIPMRTEQFILLSIPRFEGAINDEDFIWIQMYVDSVMPIIEGEEITGIVVNDWKTSSKFDKEKLVVASRQLLLYKLGIEQKTGVTVTKLGWSMLKYVYCCYWTKGSKVSEPEIKKSMQERKDSVKFLANKITQDLIDSGMDTMSAELMVSKALHLNSLKAFPQFIQDKYWIEDCFLECEFDDEIMKNCLKWVIDTVKEIESITEHIPTNYPPVEINGKTKYFCLQLCGRPNCPYLLKYKCDNIDAYKKKKSEEKISSVLGNNQNINLDILFRK